MVILFEMGTLMALDSTPICFRVSPEERETLEMVSARLGRPLSAFMRYAGIRVAHEIIDEGGGMDAFKKWYADVRELCARYE
jgi:uncharacterized protein (DUF1778 family)